MPYKTIRLLDLEYSKRICCDPIKRFYTGKIIARSVKYLKIDNCSVQTASKASPYHFSRLPFFRCFEHMINFSDRPTHLKFRRSGTGNRNKTKSSLNKKFVTSFTFLARFPKTRSRDVTACEN